MVATRSYYSTGSFRRERGGLSGGFGLIDWQAGTGQGSADWWCCVGTSPHFHKMLAAGFLLSRLYGRRHLVPRVSSSASSSVDFLRWKKVEGEDHQAALGGFQDAVWDRTCPSSTLGSSLCLTPSLNQRRTNCDSSWLRRKNH